MSSEERVQVDGLIFGLGTLLLLSVIVPIVLVPDQTSEWIDFLFEFLTEELGILYILLAIFVTGFLGYVALSPFGSIRLGDGAPPHSTFSWASMLLGQTLSLPVMRIRTPELPAPRSGRKRHSRVSS